MGRILDSQTNGTTSRLPQYSGRILPNYKPTESVGSKVLQYGKSVAEDALSTLLIKPAQQATSAITQTFFPNSLAAKGFAQNDASGNGQDLKLGVIGDYNIPSPKAFGQGGGEQIVGQALHSAAYLAPYKIAGAFGGNLAGDIAAGSIGGAAFGAGGAMEQGASPKETLKQTAIGGALGVVAPLAIRGVGRILSSKVKVPTPEVVNPSVSPEIPVSNTPNILNESPTNPRIQEPAVQSEISKIVEQARQQSPDPQTFESTTVKQATERILSQSKEHINNVVNLKEQPIQGTTFADYWRVAGDLASKEGDVQKLYDLGLSTPKQIKSSLAGKELGAFSQIDKTSTPSILSSIYEEKLGKLPGRVISNQSAETKTIQDSLKGFFDNFKEKIPTSEEILSAVKELDNIICKE